MLGRHSSRLQSAQTNLVALGSDYNRAWCKGMTTAMHAIELLQDNVTRVYGTFSLSLSSNDP